MIIDAQVHLFEADTPARPWPKDGRDPPVMKLPEFTGEHMIRAMDAIGVDRAVIVPPVWAGDHNETALSIAARYPERFAVMGRIDPWAEGSSQAIETWLSQPGMLGVRISSRWGSHTRLFEEMLEDPEVAWFWDSCERLGIPIMALTRAGIERAEPMIAAHRKLRFIVDHLGTVSGPALQEAFRHIDTLVSLAQYDNVLVKVSTAPNHSREPFPFADTHPYLRRIYDAYGARRLLWAADLTQLTKNTYDECLRLWSEALPFLTGDDREWILGRTASEVLRWP
jgi:predicted TIM-barrel fold metal-dependent hydrolase